MSDVYLKTIERLEPDIHSIDAGAYYASAAISLKRIADALSGANEAEIARLKERMNALYGKFEGKI